MTTSGTISLAYVHYKIDVNLAFQQVLVVSTGDQTHDRHRSPDTANVTDVLMQNCHRCPER